MTTAEQQLQSAASMFREFGSVPPTEVVLDQESVPQLVKFSGNPVRFLPKMFDGDWEVLGVHPTVGPARILRVLSDRHNLTRVIVRQGPSLFIFTAPGASEDE